ncbi:transporter [Hyphomicrobium sulfonivorans]|uniref:transporter n=1 Tax=Hyphomicrobium sulfonivorans TaxID=121290 RepID=UPI00156EE706|nr:transporter [Hyphomicrobium sulfonivorans]MBI1648960.1 transporter [Hyphomicrobium sulfonivorans]NSL70505.1 hypothetical protein [Hyphomicrobium sulfonivorans]
MRKAVFCFVVALGSAGISEGAAADDKSGYNLFNPTPTRLMRDMTTDRPDMTETPFTVDAGHVQIETTLFGFGRSHADETGGEMDTYEFFNANVRIGLSNSTEINFVWQPHGKTHYRQPGLATERASGVGGFDIRGKVNLWGNDNAAEIGSALALLPYITLPTNDNNGISPKHVEGGLIVPLAIELPNNFGLGINGGVSWVRGDISGKYEAGYVTTAALAYEWTEKFGTYYEIAASFGALAPGGTALVLATGLTYAINGNLQLDAGINVGVTDTADRFNPFIGLSQRF